MATSCYISQAWLMALPIDGLAMLNYWNVARLSTISAFSSRLLMSW